ncbi:MAG: ATP-binding protein [Ignavibacteria bacterium]|jgi:serine/threonine-protein kinase RsbW
MTKISKNFKKEIVVKSSTDNLSRVRDFTKSAAENIGFSQDAIGKIILAVDEACTNVIKHAYKYSAEGVISVSVNFKKPKFVISITDEGTHFDPELIPEPDIKEYHKQKKVGGLGMFLMKKLMDEVKYKNLSDNRNQVILVKYLQ